MDLSWDVIQLSLIIVGARVLDVSIGILRIISVVRGRRLVAVLLGFLEALIWVFAISKVTAHLDKPIYMVAFAFGFSLGNFVGLTLERRLAYGNQVIRIFTRLGSEMAEKLRDLNYKITIFNGKGRAGPIDMLLLKTSRKEMPALLERVRGIDAESFYFVDDITLTSDAPVSSIFAPGMLRLKRK